MSLHRILSFEEGDNLKKFGKSLDNKNTEEDENNNTQINNKSHKNSEKQNYYTRKLTKRSKIRLLIRILLFCLTLIFIPLQSIIYNNLMRIEQNTLFIRLQNWISYDELASENYKNVLHVFRYFLNKDNLSGVACVLYTIFHPFVALKLIFSAGITFYIMILMKCYYQSKRPSWDEQLNNQEMIECDASFSNPSSTIFNLIFYSIYGLFLYRSFYKEQKGINIWIKSILLVLFILFFVFETLLLLLYKLHFLHEIVYSSVITLVLICILIDLDDNFQSKFFNATKNLFKTRKNKIKVFFLCSGLLLTGIVCFNFFPTKTSLFQVEKHFAESKSCNNENKEELGLNITFMDITYIFSIIGAFWGACLTIEHSPGEWWYQPTVMENVNPQRDPMQLIFTINESNNNKKDIFLIVIKALVTAATSFILCYIFKLLPYITFEFNFILNCVKYFMIYFIPTGILPIIYGYLGMNKKKIYKFEDGDNDPQFDDSFYYIDKNVNNLFTPSLFAEYNERSKFPVLRKEIKVMEENNNRINEIMDPNELNRNTATVL